MEGVFVALGTRYLEARELVREWASKSGVSQGFVMGILGWEWRHVMDRFYKRYVIYTGAFDEATDVIRVKAYNASLRSAFMLGTVLPDAENRVFVSGLRKIAGHPSSGAWTRNDQISFVISLAAAFENRCLR